MIAFLFGGTFVGIAGGLYAYYISFLNVGRRVRHRHQRADRAGGPAGRARHPVGPGAGRLHPGAGFAKLTSTGLGGADAGAIRLLLFGGLLGAGGAVPAPGRAAHRDPGLVAGPRPAAPATPDDRSTAHGAGLGPALLTVYPR